MTTLQRAILDGIAVFCILIMALGAALAYINDNPTVGLVILGVGFAAILAATVVQQVLQKQKSN
ncbi:UNVERIFIED_ORG: putative membrane protein YdfJ with MMPL/SSD domain [Rhodococcus erythropolis]